MVHIATADGPVHPRQLQFIRPMPALIASRSRRPSALPRVRSIDSPKPDQEPSMNRSLRTQAASLSLAVFVTLATLVGLNSLATTGHASAQWAKAAATQSA